jgi:riboflavin kinase/FMN adenylyltransferase
VVAIGNFDGVHRGHRHIFERARALEPEAELTVLTFDPHPAKVLAPSLAPPLISTQRRKMALLAEAGVELTVVQPFDTAFAAQSPDEFVESLLVTSLRARRVCVGYDFTFGRKRAGNTELLTALGKQHGFEVSVIPAFTVDGLVCSSTKVREFTLEGRVDGAAQILGRDPEVEGIVVAGAKRGRALGIPTANLQLESELLPKNGVYAGWAELVGDDGRAASERWVAAINVGTNPTFTDENRVIVEAHLLDVDVDLYGARLRVGFGRRLRAEERYASVDELMAQIARDIDDTRAFARQRGLA